MRKPGPKNVEGAVPGVDENAGVALRLNVVDNLEARRNKKKGKEEGKREEKERKKRGNGALSQPFLGATCTVFRCMLLSRWVPTNDLGPDQ